MPILDGNQAIMTHDDNADGVADNQGLVPARAHDRDNFGQPDELNPTDQTVHEPA